MAEIRLVSELIQICENVSLYGELLTLVELSKNHKNLVWKGGSRFSYDIECDGKKIEVKSCNVDNDWAKGEWKKDHSFKSGFDKIYPDRFNYLVCVSFRNDFSDVKYYVFKSEEVRLFQKGKWKQFPEAYTLEVRKHEDDKRNMSIEKSKDAWKKMQ